MQDDTFLTSFRNVLRLASTHSDELSKTGETVGNRKFRFSLDLTFLPLSYRREILISSESYLFNPKKICHINFAWIVYLRKESTIMSMRNRLASGRSPSTAGDFGISTKVRW